jgi:hypothetical protein
MKYANSITAEGFIESVTIDWLWLLKPKNFAAPCNSKQASGQINEGRAVLN